MPQRPPRTATALALSALICGAASLASAQDAPAPKPAAKHVLQALTPDDLDPAGLLPAPAADGTPVQAAELAEVQRAYRTRTPERYAQAQWDDAHEDPTIFASVIGPAFDLTKLPATAKLLAVVDNDQAIAATMAKRYFLRKRPWAMDPDMKPCDYKPNANPLTSYPSGHATLGYSVGYVLAALMPDKAQAIFTRAQDYAYSREVCGDHYPSDTEASHALGTAVAIKLLNKPQIAPMFEAARAELQAAGLSAPRRLASAQP
jgi:acid phosphatase (class A)